MHVQSYLSIFTPYRFSTDGGHWKLQLPSSHYLFNKLQNYHFIVVISAHQRASNSRLKDPWTKILVSRTLESEDVHLFKFRLRSVENQLLKNDPRSVHRVHTPVTFSLATNRQLNRLTHFFVSQCSASITVFCISYYEGVFHLSRSWNRTNRYRFPPAPGFVSSPKNIQFRANFVSVVFYCQYLKNQESSRCRWNYLLSNYILS